MKRRKRRARHAGRRDAFHLTMIAVLMTVLCLMIVNIKEPEQTEEEQPETTHAEVVQNPETIVQTAEETENKYKVFDGMSEDWGSDDLEGFVLYKLPEQYADKGYFPEKMQIYTRCLCKQNDVPYALVVAIIEHESGYEFDKVGDGGQSKGYMQIYEKWHTDRMKRLSCTDLMNPYQNVRVGIDFLSYLLKKYGTVQDALAAYNYGEKGAREHLWSNGVYVYSYNSAIMQRMGYLSNTDTYDMYLQRVKPYVNVKKLKKIVSKHSKRKEREKHERMERSVRNGGRTAGGVRHNSVTDNGISETQYQESNERGCRRKENHRMAARGA